MFLLCFASLLEDKKEVIAKEPKLYEVTLQPGESYEFTSKNQYSLYSLTTISSDIRIRFWDKNNENEDTVYTVDDYPNNTQMQFFSKKIFSSLNLTASGESESSFKLSTAYFPVDCSYGILVTNFYHKKFNTKNRENEIPHPIFGLQDRCIFINGGYGDVTMVFNGDMKSGDSVSYNNKELASQSTNSFTQTFSESDTPLYIKITTGSEEDSRSFEFSLDSSLSGNPSFITTNEFTLRKSFLSENDSINRTALYVGVVIAAVVIVSIIIGVVVCLLKKKRFRINNASPAQIDNSSTENTQ